MCLNPQIISKTGNQQAAFQWFLTSTWFCLDLIRADFSVFAHARGELWPGLLQLCLSAYSRSHLLFYMSYSPTLANTKEHIIPRGESSSNGILNNSKKRPRTLLKVQRVTSTSFCVLNDTKASQLLKSHSTTEEINLREIESEIRLACLLHVQLYFLWPIQSTAENIEDLHSDCYSQWLDYQIYATMKCHYSCVIWFVVIKY